jgi:hypothetical protein
MNNIDGPPARQAARTVRRFFRDLICQIFGHARPEWHLRESICSRCRIVVEYHSNQFVLPATMRDGRLEIEIPGAEEE